METLALCLADELNEYQQVVKADTQLAAQRAGLKLDVYFAGGKVTQQIRQVYECLHREANRRPKAIVIMPVRVNSLGRIAREVLQAGIGWVCINRRMDDLQRLREEFAGLPICFVSPDQREIGRIQGRQFRRLLPRGGQTLYVQGDATSSAAQERLAGMQEAIRGSHVQVAGVLDGNWSTTDAERVVSSWLRIVASGKWQIDLVGCQNDAMAVGARQALKSVADYLRQPELATIPVTGCDGVPGFGQRLVREGQLAATVIMPSTGGHAVELIARVLSQGGQPPAEVLLPPTPFPAEAALTG